MIRDNDYAAMVAGFPSWQRCIEHFKTQLTPQQFNTWIAPLTVSVDAQGVLVQAPNAFIHKWVRERFWDDICNLISSTDSRPVRLIIGKAAQGGWVEPVSELVVNEKNATTSSRVVARTAEGSSNNSNAVNEVDQTYTTTNNTSKHTLSVNEDQVQYSRVTASEIVANNDSALQAGLTFATFVTGKANQLALAAGRQVADNPGGGYNPLFVYGGVGLGKTHLIQAIGHQFLQNQPKARVRYMHSERYVQDVMRAYQRKSFNEFKSSYRSLDLLLIDDIQFFEGKERTQEEFFYLFNTLIEARKQIIITSDTFPKEITGLDERLRSRFGWGLTVQLEPPETEMRVAILLSKAKAVNFEIDETVAFFVAKQIRSNVRELEGALKRIFAYSNFHNIAPSLTVAKEALKDLLAAQNRQISVENIQKTVADYYKIKVADMHSKSRARSVARPRQVAMYLTKELTRLSLPEIGQSFGGRDHTTVLHACRQIIALRDSLVDIQRDTAFLLQVLRG